MKFNTVAEAFNFYRNKTIEEMETRAREIGAEIDSNPDVDMNALNIELSGIKEARANIETRSQAQNTLSFLTGLKSEPARPVEYGDDVYATEEYRSAFFKTMLNQKLNEKETAAFDAGMKLAERRSDAYNTASNSAAVLPTQTLNEIIKKARTMGGLLAECRAFSMPTKISIPIGTPSDKASWHAETDAVESEAVSVAKVDFDGYEIMKIFSISEKARKMSIGAFESYIVDELNACVMDLLAYAIVNGTGSGQGLGIESGVTWAKTGAGKNEIEVAAASDLTYEDVVDTVALLKRGYAQGAKWAMNNKSLYTYFYSLVDDTGRPIFIADPKSESIGKILGFDVVIDDNIADGKIYLGNYKKYMGYNLPEGIVIESSRDSGFKRGVTDYRALAIADCKPLVADAFVRLHKKQS